MKPDGICHYDGCDRPAKWSCEMILLGTLLRGATTVKVCSEHRLAAEAFILNDDNRTRLANHLVSEGFCDPFTAFGMAKHNVAVNFDRIHHRLL